MKAEVISSLIVPMVCMDVKQLTKMKEVRAGGLYARGGDMGSPPIIVPMVCMDIKQLGKKERKTRRVRAG